MDPVVQIRLLHPGSRFTPGEALRCEYLVQLDDPSQIQALEASVMWFTEGKGEEDLAVQYFERHVPADYVGGDMRGPWQFSTLLPRSPLSYSGVIVKVRWCVRVRVFLARGRGVTAEVPFQLGNLPPTRALLRPTAEPPRAEVEASDELDE